MDYETELRQSLGLATKLVLDAIDKKISIPDFVDRYGNYYHFEALDGHESDDERRVPEEEYSKLISMHERVQTQVVDKIYLGPESQREVYLAAGRIDEIEAMSLLNELNSSCDIRGLLNTLDATGSI